MKLSHLRLEQRQVGVIIILFSLVLLGILYQVNSELQARNALLHQDCTLPEAVCPFAPSVPHFSLIGFILLGLLLAFGVFLVVTDRPLPAEPVRKEEWEQKAAALQGEEKAVYETVLQADGIILQGDLVEKTGLSKVKVTRVLDHLEARGLVERKRRGMSNVVVLK